MTDNIVSKHGCLLSGVCIHKTWVCEFIKLGATLITLQWKDANKSKF